MSSDNEKRIIQISQPVTGEDEWQAMRPSIMSGWLTQGPKVAQFEREFAKRHDVKHALAVTSCTTGMHLALAGLGIKAGDEVIVPAFTWVATANVVEYCGATPVFVDVDPITYNIDINQVAEKITDKTVAIIPVHLFGLCTDIDALRKVIPAHIKIIEDAACASGADLRGNPAGSLGDVGVFSFHPRKSITTGEGGMVTTNDTELFEKMNMLRNHGASISEEQRHNGPRPYSLPDFAFLGFNYRMTDLQGSVGIVQLEKLDGFINERAKKAEIYKQELADVAWLSMPTTLENSRHGWQSFITTVNPDIAPMPRNEIMEKLQADGISTRPGTHAVHMLGYYREKYSIKPEDFPNARDCNNNTMAIPLHNRMSDEDYQYIINKIKAL